MVINLIASRSKGGCAWNYAPQHVEEVFFYKFHIITELKVTYDDVDIFSINHLMRKEQVLGCKRRNSVAIRTQLCRWYKYISPFIINHYLLNKFPKKKLFHVVANVWGVVWIYTHAAHDTAHSTGLIRVPKLLRLCFRRLILFFRHQKLSLPHSTCFRPCLRISCQVINVILEFRVATFLF